MSEKYFDLKRQLELLGYNKHLPPNAVPLVECLTADLLQTTRSLQHYMETAQDALRQRDDLVLQAEPYKCDNARLIKENNHLNQILLNLKEDNLKLVKETSRKLKSLQEEVIVKENVIIKLKQQYKELGLRGAMANTLSFRNKMRNLDNKSNIKQCCNCLNRDTLDTNSKIVELQKELKELKEISESYKDEIVLLQKKVDHRDDEINRLQILLEGGRPLSAVRKECSGIDLGHKVTLMYKEFQELESENLSLRNQLEQSVEKQHEAMLRAVNLADKNKILEEELSKLDKLALKVEDECNNQIKTKNHENIYLREKVSELLTKNNELQTELVTRRNDSIQKLENSVVEIQKIKDYLNSALKEKDDFFHQVKTLESLNQSLQEKLALALSQVNNIRCQCNYSNLATKDDLIDLMEKEKQDFVSNSLLVQNRVADALEDFSKNFSNPQKNCKDPLNNINELNSKINEIEHKVIELEKENLELKSKQTCCSDHCIGEKLAELKAINDNLRKENMKLCNYFSYQNQGTSTVEEVQLEKSKNTIMKLNEEIERLISKINMFKNEKRETMAQYKDALDTIDSLKRELSKNRSHIDKLEEENASHRMTSHSARSGRGSVDHMRDEYHYLREQILHMQSELMKEKSLVLQMKNAQSDVDRNSIELENELLNVKKQLALSSDRHITSESLIKDLKAEILSLRIEKSKLLEDLQLLDKERHDLVIEVEKKSECLHLLEQQNKSKMCAIERLENQIAEMKEVNILNNISEQRIKDYESKIYFLNSEIQRLKEHNDNSMVENKHLQSSLANVNNALKNTKLEYDRAQKDADSLRLQLQHYVAEVKRIEDMLSHKEAERADMLENFASLSVEANLLENTNHSLENESASKSMQLQTFKGKIEELEERLLNKEKEIDSQSDRIANFSCKYANMESELTLITKEKEILIRNNNDLKELIQKLESEKKSMGQGIQSTDSELQLYEHKIKKLMETKTHLEVENRKLKANIQSVENLLTASRREVIELKIALQDATSDTQILKKEISKLNERVIRSHDLTVAGSDKSRITIGDEHTEPSHAGDLVNEMRCFDLNRKHSFNYRHGSTL